MDGFDLGSVVAHIKADTTQFMGGLSQMSNGLSGLVGGAGMVAGAIAGIAVAAVGAFSVKEAVEFNKQMVLIQTQAGASKEEMLNMSKAVLDMGGTVAQGPIELSKALFHIESAGYRGAAALDILKVASEGAAVGNANLEDVTNALVAAEATHIKGLGDTSNAMGVLNAIVGSGNMRMADLTAALSTGILPAARSVGISIQDVGAAIDTMTINGVPAIDAATRLRMTFSLMEAPTSKATKALATIGMTSNQLADDMRNKGLLPALNDLEDHLTHSGMTATEQAQVISHAFGGGRTSSAILTLLGNLDTMQKSFDNIGSTANNFAADVAAAAETPAERWDKFKSGIQALAIRIGQDLLPALDGALVGLTKFVSWLEKMVGVLDPYAKAAFHDIAVVIKLIYDTLSGGDPTLKKADAGFSGFAKTLINLRQGFFNVIDAVRQAWNWFVNSAPVIILVQFIQQVFWPALKAIAMTIWNDLLPSLEKLWDSLVRLWNALQPALMDALKIIGAIIGGLLLAAIWALMAGLNVLIHVFSFVISVISDVIGWIANLISWFGNIVGVVWNAIKTITDIFWHLPGAIKDVFLTMLSIAGSLLGGFFDLGKNIVQGIINGLESMVGAVENKIKSVANGIKDIAKKILGIFSPSTIFHEMGMNVGQGLINGMTAMQDAVGKASNDMASAIIGPAAAVVGTSNLVAQSPSVTTHINGDINIGSDVDAQNFLKQLTQNQELAMKGITPVK